MSEWISVNDALPCEADDVLLLCKSQDDKFNSIIVGRYSPHMHRAANGAIPWTVKLFGMENIYLCMEANRIYNPKDSDHFYFGNVTHWMPLPELPS